MFVSVASTFVGLVYNIYLHGRYGQTLGKIVAKVKVVSTDETPIGFRRAFRRELLYLPATLSLTVLDLVRAASSEGATGLQIGDPPSWSDLAAWLLFFIFLVDVIVTLSNDRRRSLHDLIAGTVVVRMNVS